MIFLISDVHTRETVLDKHVSRIESEIARPLDERDTLICLGDLFGLPARKAPSLSAKIAADRKFVEHVEKYPFDVLCLHGNHDDAKRVYRIGSYDAYCWGQHTRRVGTNIFYLDDGQIYDIPVDATAPEGESVSVLALGGAFGHMYRFNGASKEQEAAFYRRYMPLMFATSPIEVDYVLAHEAPTSRLGRFVRTVFGATPASNVLDAVEDNLVFYEWYFGHHHFDLEPHPHFHCLYRREVELKAPEGGAERFNSKLLYESDCHEDDDVSTDEDENTCDDESNPGEGSTFTDLAIAICSGSGIEERLVTGMPSVPRIPSDREVELLVECMKEDAKAKRQGDEKSPAIEEPEIADTDEKTEGEALGGVEEDGKK